MKKFFYLCFVILSSSFIVSCNKNIEQKDINTRNLQRHLIISAFHDSITDVFSGYDIDFKLNWSRYYNDSLVADNYVFLDYSDYDSARYIFNSDTTITVINLDLDTLTFSGFNYRVAADGTNTLLFNVTAQSNSSVLFRISSDLYDLNPYGYFNTKSVCNPAVLFAAACLIAGAIDYYCDSKIKRGADQCTAEGKCTKIKTCEVECVECRKN